VLTPESPEQIRVAPWPFCKDRVRLRNWRRWKTVDHATISFGQGISVTPIQLAAATAALANDGVWQKPRFIDAYRERDGKWQEAPREVGHRVIGREAAAVTLRMMESVVSASGTGRRAALTGLRVAGKTGTAQKFDRQAGRYSRSDYLAWFIGVAPADDPKVAIVVVIDEPKGVAHGGGDHAAPLFALLASAQLAHLGIVTEPAHLRPRRFRTLIAASEAAAKAAADAEPSPSGEGLPAVSAPAQLVPDFRGETVAGAQRIAAEDSLVLELHGDGRGLAVEQDPAPGTVLVGEELRIRVHFSTDKKPRAEEG
jgi:cell division protein FtsI (penicillin-binding protein 3)